MSGKELKPKKIISQKDYLKKYLSGGKKKKEKIKIKRRVKIIDDNIDCVENNETDSNNLIGLNSVDEYAPQIVGVIDERPQEVKTLDMYKNKTRWKRIGEEDDIQIEHNTNTNIQQVQNYVKQINKSTLKDLLKKDNDDEINCTPIMRDRKTGKKRNIEKEKEEQQQKNDILRQHKEKYAIWGKGIKQVENAKEQYQNDLHEMQKPFARYANDDDLENMLKSKIRDGDPMLEYIRNNKDIGETSPDGIRHETREFRGFCPPNRFNIRPGQRWDGVNRSNGYEEKWLLRKNSQKAVEDEAYKWSCSDM